MGLLLTFSVLSFFVLFPELCRSEDPFICSRATYYGSPDCLGTPSGACGFGEFGRNINGGDVSAVAKLYRNGTGCGACYQVRCTQPELCSQDGVRIIVTDHGQGDNTDFILSRRGFGKLARPYMAAELIAHGVVDIEYRRVSCQYPGYNLMFKVHEYSRFPDYLAIIILYQAGQKDITAVELWQEDCQEWRAMRRAFGGVWDRANPPKGPLNLRFQVSGEEGQKWIQLRNVIPSDWKAGVAYDSAIQLF
ncbi:expansin-like B1 [Magnolia sinica]|uniref:expansin-like B1 n=1 Tax=Magnolia sinica TaxID=86752 RepID=UPI002659A310|nr:expansin-like B1 [Magnolia sinica]